MSKTITTSITIPSAYTLPPATTSTLGGVKPDGSTLTTDDSGKISVKNGSGTTSITLSDVYPVGSIYMNFGSTLPEVIRNIGTWEQIAEGTFLTSAGSTYTAMSSGGSNDAVVVAHDHNGSTNSAGSHYHDGTATSAGSHTHNASTTSAGAHTHKPDHSSTYFVDLTQASSDVGLTATDVRYGYKAATATASAGSHTHSVTVTSGGSHTHNIDIDEAGSHSHTVTIDSAGESGKNKNMPKYLAVSMWRRVS